MNEILSLNTKIRELDEKFRKEKGELDEQLVKDKYTLDALHSENREL